MSGERTGREIAIVGMAGRFPGARDLGELWANLSGGVEGIVRFTDDELRAAGVEPERLADPSYVKAGSPLADVDRFDAHFFGYSAREAELLDPQHRLFLETVWQALEDSGHRPGGYDGLIGVYAGAAWNTYLLSNLTTRPELFEGTGAFQIFTASDKDFLPTRVSYKLDLRGPSVLVQTSCSTSLVATHLACLSLLNYECDLALAGGVTVKVPQVAGYFHEEGGLASPDGRCRTFDADAAGTVFGSGVGVVALKRLEEALADGDTIRAVVLGSAINNDGSLKVSYTAPSVEGQAEVIAAAQAVAGVDPATVGYVEAHGTATSLGDPIEVAALAKAFAAGSGDRAAPCVLGSIKSNLGHLDAAAGVAGLIKTVLALEHGEVPPSLHYEAPNPAIDLSSGPFAVAAERMPWPRGATPRRAGVSSFGVGGTNAHLVLEEAPEVAPGDPARPGHLLLVSARSEAALDAACERLRDHLRERVGDDHEALADVAWTLQAGRTVFRHRRALVCRDRDDAVALLSGSDPECVRSAVDEDDPRPRPVAFVFPGAAPDADSVRALAASEPAFREALDGYLGLAGAALDDPDTGPVRVAVELALTALWREWGVVPSAAHGRGWGELAGACAAGTLEPEEALRRAAGAGAPPDPAPAEPDGDPGRVVLQIGPADRMGLLAALGTLWLAGVAVDWGLVYRGERRRRVPLPTYPFERGRFWIEPAPRVAAGAAQPDAGRRPDPADWLYLPAWKPALPPAASPVPRRWLVLAPEGEVGRTLVAALAERGHEVTAVLPGPDFSRRPDGAFTVDPRSPDDLRAVLESVEGALEGIVDAWALGGSAAGPAMAVFESAQATGFLGLLALGRALAAAGADPGTPLLVLADGLDGPGPAAPHRPELAPMLALLRVLSQEVPGLRCRAVDVAAPARRARELAGILEREATDESPVAAVAWRGLERWTEAFESVRLPPCPDGARVARVDAAYLVTGGLDGLGLHIARLLACEPGTRLVLLESEEPRVGGPRAAALAELRELAASAELQVAPPGDRAGVARAVAAADAAPGGLRGVVHAAGPAGIESFRLLAEADPESCRPHFEARVHRFLELDAALAAEPARELDFAWALSSLASVLGGAGNAAYAGSNRFLEAFARDRAARGGAPAWSAVAWDAVRPGESGADAGFAHRREDVAELALSAEECEEVARRLLALPAGGRLLISTADLDARIEAAERRARGRVEGEAVAEPAERHPRPALPVAFAPPRGELESTIAEVWGGVLGFERIGANDNFFDLGGDSFLATRLATRLREALGVDLPVARLYEGTTVRSLARILEAAGADGPSPHAELLEERRESGERRKEVLQQRRARRQAEEVA